MRTWAPKGQTPIIQFHFNWNHVSVIAGLTRTNCLFRLHEGSIKKEEIVDSLKALKTHLKQPLLVIWDGLKAHRSRLVREYLDGLNGHIQIAFLPPYAPDMNPVEYLWAWLKRHAMANYCPNNLSELHVTARNKLKSAQKRPRSLPLAGCRLRCGDVMNYGSLNSYSTELNREKRLNADLKQAMGKRVPVRTKAKLRDAANEHMAMLEKSPQRVASSKTPVANTLLENS